MNHFFFTSIIVCTTLLGMDNNALAQKGNSSNQDERRENEASKSQKRFGDALLSLQKAKAADAADSNRPKKKNGK